MRLVCVGCCADFDLRFAVFPLRPSFDRATDRRSSPAVQPSSGFHPGRLPASTSASPGFFDPRASAHFQRSGREPSPTFDVTHEELARALADCRRLLPRGFPVVGDGRFAPPLLRSSCSRPRVASAIRSRVYFAVAGRLLLRGRDPLSRSWFVVVPPDEAHTNHRAIARQAPGALSTVAGTPDFYVSLDGWPTNGEVPSGFTRPSTACEQRGYAQMMTRTRGDSHPPALVRRG